MALQSKPKPQLPAFIRPMLATRGAPFDSEQHLFEIKWDGIRALVYVESNGYRLVSRRGYDLTGQFPELAALAGLPAGTVLDGELVVLRNGKPDRSLVGSRQQLASAHKIKTFSRSTPATYITFDQLFDRYRSLMNQPLVRRRQVMCDTITRARVPHMVASDGVVGAGTAFYLQVAAQQLEGVMAKRLAGRYRAGVRSGAWIKIKPTT